MHLKEEKCYNLKPDIGLLHQYKDGLQPTEEKSESYHGSPRTTEYLGVQGIPWVHQLPWQVLPNLATTLAPLYQ